MFRNETVDNSHLAEFHQVEGFIIDRNLGLNHLIGTLSEFYHKIGITDLSFKPTYNPYTEPSMEVYGTLIYIFRCESHYQEKDGDRQLRDLQTRNVEADGLPR